MKKSIQTGSGHMFNKFQLIGENIRIVPMEIHYINELYEIGRDESIWRHLPETVHTSRGYEKCCEGSDR